MELTVTSAIQLSNQKKSFKNSRKERAKEVALENAIMELTVTSVIQLSKTENNFKTHEMKPHKEEAKEVGLLRMQSWNSLDASDPLLAAAALPPDQCSTTVDFKRNYGTDTGCIVLYCTSL